MLPPMSASCYDAARVCMHVDEPVQLERGALMRVKVYVSRQRMRMTMPMNGTVGSAAQRSA